MTNNSRRSIGMTNRSQPRQTPISLPSLPETPTELDRPRMLGQFETWMTQWLVVRASVEPTAIDRDKPLVDYGLDSMTAVELSGEIHDLAGVELTPLAIWEHPTIAKLCEYIVGQAIGCDAGSELTT